MAGINSIFNSAKSGLQSQQYSLNVTSNNIANASTKGYTKQVVNIQTSSTYNLVGVGQLGTGVDVVSIERVRDALLDEQIRFESSNQEKFKSTADVLNQVEMIYQEPGDSGLANIMNDMWESWQELSKSPESSNARTIVVQNGVSFTDTLNHMYKQLESLQSNVVTSLETEANYVNSIVDQVGDLNAQIHKLEINGIKANDLYDRRDLLLDDLSNHMDFKTEVDQFNRVKIIEEDTGSDLVLLDFNQEDNPQAEMSVVRKAVPDGAGGWNLTIAKNGDVTDMHTVNVSSGDYKDGQVIYTEPSNWADYIAGAVSEPTITNANLQTGSMAGESDALDNIDQYMGQLDQLANSIATAINTVHRDDGTDLNGGIDFYVTNDGSAQISAKNITVNQSIVDDVSLINTKKETTSASGNGDRALAIAQLRNGTFPVSDATNYGTYVTGNYDQSTMSITSDVAGTSFDGYYTDSVALLGTQTQAAERNNENQETLLLQLNQRKESLSGVSLDEETANLIKFQAAYQANARVISTLEQMLDTLVNRMGV